MQRRPSLPPAVYALVDGAAGTVLLEDSRTADTQDAEEPWTRLFTAPLRICAAYQPAEIPALFAAIESAVAVGLTAAGFFSYECGICFEPKSEMRPPAEGQPLAWFGIYQRGFRFDRETGEFLEGAPEGWTSLRAAAETAFECVLEPNLEAEFALAEGEYSERIAAIHARIRAGDVYQLNFTAPWRVRTAASAAALYARLRARQPVAFGAFLHWREGRRILSFSPELFFRVDDEGGARRITARPMKGTSRRGRTTREDRDLAEWLRNDPKNRSENVMIVDLVRNDLGRVARTGSVRAEKLFAVERYPTLWQMTSTVTAELRADVGFAAIFRALFPCGSVTGAPKVRAMQLIAGLEDGPRGAYTGAIGFFSPSQTVFNVAIRTLELESEREGCRGTMGAGSGIIIDSIAAEEYRECLLKAEFLTRPSGRLPERFSLIETMLWKDGFPLLELHLDRLQDSAAYFGFPCDRATVKAALESHARAFAQGAARKVRLLLDDLGQWRISDEESEDSGASQRPARVRLAREHTDSADPMLFHKTTHRPLYAPAFAEATRDGFDEVLFLNQRSEITEGAISNVFVEKEGRWLTPPVGCGLLGGVYRRHLLETHPNFEERVLHVEDLRRADAVYLCNSVRGLRRAVLNPDPNP